MCKEKKSQRLSVSHCPLGSISSRALRGQRIGRNQTTKPPSGLWLLTRLPRASDSLLSGLAGPQSLSCLFKNTDWALTRLFTTASSSQATLQGTDLITSPKRRPGLRDANGIVVGGSSLPIRRCGCESPPAPAI